MSFCFYLACGSGKRVGECALFKNSFLVPELEDALPQSSKGRNGHTMPTVLGLSTVRTHSGLNFALDQFAEARDAARELLLASPLMKAKDANARVLSQTGQTMSKASVSRLRHRLKTEGF
jgi:hypothetical protein